MVKGLCFYRVLMSKTYIKLKSLVLKLYLTQTKPNCVLIFGQIRKNIESSSIGY